MNLKVDDTARKLSWRARWYIAQEIGGSLRYLHEECGGEPIVRYSVPLMLSFLFVVNYSVHLMLSFLIVEQW
ncbi:hypothetical protein WN944_006376 [Citrus x changshan-huyou]|uniref:Uncharacterized protein n=1 Tax=Citrus x changshan-huyou TaxID=2935761 RepID=A0AAP0MJ27_9ROSI